VFTVMGGFMAGAGVLTVHPAPPCATGKVVLAGPSLSQGLRRSG
jgi:hypothetical protein